MATTDTPDEIQHGLYLPSLPSMTGDLCSPSRFVEYAVAAENAGWDGIFMADMITLPEHGATTFDLWTTFAAIAERTERIRLASWIVPLARHQPWQIALEAATLDELSQGRFILGTGLGIPTNYEVIGMEYEPRALAERFDESLDIIEALWEGEPVTHSGTYYTLDQLQLPITPVQEPRIPLHMACWWPNKKPARRAARYDGFMPWVDPSYYGEPGEIEPSPDALAELLDEMISYYRDVADEPGEVVLPTDFPGEPDNFLEMARDAGADWVVRYKFLNDDHEKNTERILAGPRA